MKQKTGEFNSPSQNNGEASEIFLSSDFTDILGSIFAYNGSVNFYMFHGGTNFGFMAGANIAEANGQEVFPYYAADVTSYGNCKIVYTVEVYLDLINELDLSKTSNFDPKWP